MRCNLLAQLAENSNNFIRSSKIFIVKLPSPDPLETVNSVIFRSLEGPEFIRPRCETFLAEIIWSERYYNQVLNGPRGSFRNGVTARDCTQNFSRKWLNCILFMRDIKKNTDLHCFTLCLWVI